MEASWGTSHKTSSEKDADADLRSLTVQLERARVLEAEFRAFADSARDYAFITLGLDRNVIGWNKGAELLLGYSEEEVLGKPGALFFTPEDVSRANQTGKQLRLSATGEQKTNAGTCGKTVPGFGVAACSRLCAIRPANSAGTPK